MMQTPNYKITTQIHRTNEILENWMVGVGGLNALIEKSAISRKIEKRVVTRFETCLTMRSYGINIIVILVIAYPKIMISEFSIDGVFSKNRKACRNTF